MDARVLGQRGIGRYLSNLLRALAEGPADLSVRLYPGPGLPVREAAPKGPPLFNVEDLSQVPPGLG